MPHLLGGQKRYCLALILSEIPHLKSAQAQENLSAFPAYLTGVRLCFVFRHEQTVEHTKSNLASDKV